MKLKTVTFEIEDATLTFGNMELSVDRAVCHYQREMDYGRIVLREGHGMITLSEEPPTRKGVWVGEDDIPRVFDNVEIENKEERLRFKKVIFMYPPEKELEFVTTEVARDVKP